MLVAVSLQADYAIRLMCELARAERDAFTPVGDLAEAARVPYEYARAICGRLVCSRLLVSRRGPSGGMRLAWDADEITLLQIVYAVDGRVLLSSCSIEPGMHPGRAATELQAFWQRLDDVVAGYLALATLADVAGGDRFRREVASNLPPELTTHPPTA
jgi:Rrf2 family protein